MRTFYNKQDSWPKICTACAKRGEETTLNPGVNIYLSMFKRGIYKCKTCKAKQSKIEHEAKWKLPLFRIKKAEYIKEYQRETDAGVYAVYDKLDIIYIGQSAIPEQRRVQHFSKHIKPMDKWQPKISYDLATGKLDRKHLSFDMIEYVDNKEDRLIREKYHLEQHKLAFGDYPKYNSYSTDRKRGHIVDKRKDS
jgi:hypothetical protein